MKITFLPQDLTYEAANDQTILQAAVKAGVNIDGNCSGMGTCGKCKVKIISGNIEVCNDHHHKLSDYEIGAGYRLACCHPVSEGMIIEMPEAETTASRKKKLFSLPGGFVNKVAIEKKFISVPKASLSNQDSDEEQIRKVLAINELKLNYNVLLDMPKILKETRDVTLTIRGNEIIHIEAADKTKANYGVAVDIGTTTVVIMLWNLGTTEMIQVAANTNPQGAYGADVISRITYVIEHEENLKNIHSVIINCINKAVDEFEQGKGINPQNIYQYTVVGNTTMGHIFLGVNPSQLAISPFTPVFTNSIDVKAEELGLKANKNAKVHLVANIAGHVGSDITAGIITTDLMDCNKGHLFIDIGTNGEIVLTGNGRAVACSTAAGPAFEGSSINQGMRAARGAIEKVDILEDDVRITVIGDQIPIGICGSGIIDAVGEMIRVGIVDKSGRLLGKERLIKKGINENILKHVRESEKGNDFVLFFSKDGKSDIVITQKDVREVQLAKAAISAGITIMMKEIGINLDTLEKISIAGAFGNYIRNTSAINIGILPKIDKNKILSLGNSAGIGASMILLSMDCQERAENVARRIEHIELAVRSDFQDNYMKAMMF